MEPVTFFGVVLVTAAAGAILAKSRSNLRRIKSIQDKFSRKVEEGNETAKAVDAGKEKAIDELVGRSELKDNSKGR
jgi:hypothetical protein